MTPPIPPPASPDPPPANWLRGAGLLAFTVVVAADVYDGRLDADAWAMISGIGLVVWGPAVIIRAVRGG